MANQASISPGVYTSERELTFSAPSIGATTLASVGETLKGPAQQPIFVESYNEYKTYFGGLDTTVFSGTTIPKYEQSYIAKGFLGESNSMWAVRALGYAGYNAGNAWNIIVSYVPNFDNVFRAFGTGFPYVSQSPNQLGGTGIPYISPTGTLINNTSLINGVSATYVLPSAGGQPGMLSGGTWGYNFNVPNQEGQVNGAQFTNADAGAGVGYMNDYPSSQKMMMIYSANTYGGGGQMVLTGSTGGNWYTTGGKPWVSELTPYPMNLLSGRTFVITTNHSTGGDPSIDNVNACATDPANNTGFECTRVMDQSNGTTFANINWGPAISVYDPADNTESPLDPDKLIQRSASFAQQPIGYPVTGTSVQFNWRYGNHIGYHSGGTTGWTAQTTGTVYTWSAATQDMAVATLRSRGKYSGNVFAANVAGDVNPPGVTDFASPSFGITNAVCDGTIPAPVGCRSKRIVDINTTNYKQDFYLSGYTNAVGGSFNYEVNLDATSQKYLPRVLGTKKHDRNTHMWVEEIYPNTLKQLAASAVTFSNLRFGQVGSEISAGVTYSNYSEDWQPLGAVEGPTTPWIVSEIRGENLFRLFRIILIADGNTANESVKISIQDVDVMNKTFTLTVREFSDSDANQRIVEAYTKCTLNPGSQNYIGKKIGTENGEYAVRSKYIMVEFDENAPVDALPSGFEGYIIRNYSGATYDNEVYMDPPAEAEITEPSGWYGNIAPKPFYNLSYDLVADDIRKTYLGWSSKTGLDQDYVDYKGLNGDLTQTSPYKCGSNGTLWTGKTKGFHFDKRVSGLTTADVTQYNVGAYNFYTSGGTLGGEVGNYYTNKDYLKFTVLPYGGHDGWDEYRLTRTNTDLDIIGKTNYDAFWYNQSFTTSSCEVTDYYAYYDAMRKLSNPEDTPSGLITTPGIDYTNNLVLVNKAIQMVENDKRDSLYVVTSSNPTNQTVDGAVTNLENAALNSSYTATYWPWVRYNDTENNVRIYLPPTTEIVRNMAKTDNVSFPWFATAGYNRGMMEVDRARIKLSQTNRDDLYEARLNPIATFNGIGVVIWGQKTLQTTASALDRINVRRLMLHLSTRIKQVAIQLVFEQNDDIVRQQFLALVNPILEDVRRDRGLNDFQVQLNDDVAELDTNSLTGKIFVKPTRTLEFIELEFNITPTSVSFNDVS